MKPIFGIDITTDKNNETVNGLEFVSASVTNEQSEDLEEKQDELEQTIEKSKLPLWMRITKALCGYGALIFGLGMLRASLKSGTEQVFQRATIFVLAFFTLFAGWLILRFLANKKEKAVFAEQNAEEQVEHIQQDMRSIYAALGVPSDAVNVDVLTFFYKDKNGTVKPTERFMQMSPFVNIDVKLFTTEDALCIADTQHCFSFPKAELRAIRKINRRIPLPTWHKDEEPTKGRFKPYKMGVNQFGQVVVKPYYMLEIAHGDETFGLYFPCYDKEAFEEASGLTAEE